MAVAEELEDEFEDLGAEGEAEPEPEVSVEALARAQGWRPLGEYRGPPEKWTDAETYLRQGDENWPVMRDQNRRMAEKLARITPDYEALRGEVSELRNTVTEQKQATRDAIEMARRADQRGYDRGIAELKAEHRQAVEAGDVETADQIQERIDAAKDERRAADAPAPAPTPERHTADTVWPETRAFLAANDWARSGNAEFDAALSASLAGYHNSICSVAGLDFNDPATRTRTLEDAKAKVIKAFPHMFEQEQPAASDESRPRTPRARVLTPGSQTHQRPRTGSPFDQIEDAEERKEARAACARMQRADPGMTEEEYVSLMLNPKQDVIAVLAARKRT
jgi:hypothetical protein